LDSAESQQPAPEQQDCCLFFNIIRFPPSINIKFIHCCLTGFAFAFCHPVIGL